MKCKRCKKSRGGQQITFKHKVDGETIYVVATVCRICDFIWADDDTSLKAIRKKLYALANVHSRINNN